MTKKKQQKNFKEVLYTDITTHTLLAMAVFGLVISGFATTLLGAGFVMAEGTALGQTDNAAAVVVAMDSLVGQQGPGASAHAGGMPSPPPSAILLPRGDHGQTASSTLCAPLLITRTLMRGSRGSDVTNLQNTLILQGLLASSSATGFFGLLTEKAVAQWQHQEGIASSTTPDQSQGIGMIGPRSRAAFAKCEGRVGQMLSNGSKSPDFDHGSTTPPRPPVPPTATTSPQQ